MDCHFLLQQIFPAWGSNLCLPCIGSSESQPLDHCKYKSIVFAMLFNVTLEMGLATPCASVSLSKKNEIISEATV